MLPASPDSLHPVLHPASLDQLDSLGRLTSTLGVLHQPAFFERFLDWLQSPSGIYGTVVLTCVAALVVLHHATALAVKEAMQTVLQKQDAFTKLQTQHEHVLRVLREREQLLFQRYTLRNTSTAAHARWTATNWKSIARQQLALAECCRPLSYADYRQRVWALSPTYAVPARPVPSEPETGFRSRLGAHAWDGAVEGEAIKKGS